MDTDKRASNDLISRDNREFICYGFKIYPEQRESLREIAAKKKKTMNGLLRELIDEFLEAEANEEDWESMI